MTRKLGLIILLLCVFALPCRAQNPAQSPYDEVKEYVLTQKPYREVLSPEGRFITVFNDTAGQWIAKPIDKDLLDTMRRTLEPYLRIELNAMGFPPAAARATEGGKDETNYDAVWVRDSVWVYRSLLVDPARHGDAKKLLLALWDYYSTDAQIKRFLNIIKDPSLCEDPMNMPHIRFNGNTPATDDVMAGGKPQVWNHAQIDAHGHFFTALGEAARDGIIGVGDMTEERSRVLALYPLFLDRIKFETFEDAGAWEELRRRNTSSIALATRSIQVWRDLMYKKSGAGNKSICDKFKSFLAKNDKDVRSAWGLASLEGLIDRGLKTVKRQLLLGGESPDYSPEDIRFRLADAALLNLIIPSALDGLSEEEMRKTLLIVETLRRGAGVLRYDNDSYQSGNYWIEEPAKDDKDKPALTGDTSLREAFLWRMSKLIPDTEAEWFFDSLCCLARLALYEMTEDPQLKREDLYLAAIHLKRALGQLTGQTITADGKKIRPWQAPESINTVVVNGNKYYLPSPIAPLNWAKAALSMALAEYEKVISAGGKF